MRDIDELEELREYDAGAPPLDNATRGRMRARLLTAMDPENAAAPAPAVRHRRPVLRIALTVMVAAAVAGSVLVAVHDDGRAKGGTAAPSSTGSPALRNVSAQVVLDGAATYARQHEQPASPRNDQFIYTKEIIKETNQRTGATRTYTDENWRSVDNSKPSWVMEIGKGWWSPPPPKNETVWPPEDWATLKKLPTDPTQLILWLVEGPNGKDHSLSRLNNIDWSLAHFELSGLLKLVPVMPAGLRPAAYEALGMFPGVKVVPNQKDAKGRTGVAVTYDDPTRPKGSTGFGGYFIFNPKTYEFLGFRDQSTSGSGKNRKTYTQLSSLDTWAVVDKVKERP
ncbi:hypothetical protein SAMN05216223_12589 [Actinacidiphila yanglinensis]|uniref:Tat pathway signal protein n=1 Tax=Actinacidiphila yanglinensis TaxID=310779 RepID=A0A1H6E5I1_9ACTN|nr:CU044_5270 family protein [Actinacidiphila yanglinensis]SEG92226.1 hypothetical protein SAMN05216223_12589 [Actinacidiphila yanglinensis]